MTVRFDGTFTYETTNLPCPSWCQLPAHHEMLHVPDGVERLHQRTIGTEALTVEICSHETAGSVDGPITTTERVTTLSPDIEDRNLSSADARRLAAALLDTADLLDRLDATDWA